MRSIAQNKRIANINAVKTKRWKQIHTTDYSATIISRLQITSNDDDRVEANHISRVESWVMEFLTENIVLKKENLKRIV